MHDLPVDLPFQYSIHSPTTFLEQHLAQLLPDWWLPIVTVLVVLQKSPIPLLEKTAATEQAKEWLRQHLLFLLTTVAEQLKQQGYASDVFDPRTGFPLCSQPGCLPLDHIAVVQTTLGYPTQRLGGCRVIDHPDWKTAVYPAILVSTAPPPTVEQVLKEFCGHTTTPVPLPKA
uniref:Methylmalonic aciduria and homocystinuria type D protein n=1 Tax=Cyanothece sp. (strain PCC 7425 / ATCC 29141) TaxID=395961 RepID=B8HSJ6_CYAP4